MNANAKSISQNSEHDIYLEWKQNWSWKKGKFDFLRIKKLNLSNTCKMHPRERERGGGGGCISGCGHVAAIIGSSC